MTHMECHSISDGAAVIDKIDEIELKDELDE